MSASSDYLRVVTDVQQNKGAVAASTARANAAIWGNSIAKLGDFASDAIKSYGVEKKAKKQEQEDQALRDLFDTSQREWSQAQGTYMGPVDQPPRNDGMPPAAVRTSPFPTPGEIISAVGPIKGIPIVNGLKALHQEPTQDPKANLERLQTIYKALDVFPEDKRAEYYPGVIELLEHQGVLPQGSAPKVYDPGAWKAIGGTLKDPNKVAKEPESFTLSEGQTRFGPDGQPLANVPKPPGESGGFTLTPGGQRYDAQGNLIASVPAPAGGEAGFTLSPGQTRYGPDGKPLASRPDKPEGAGGARPVTSGDANRLAEINTAISEAKAIRPEITGLGDTGTRAQIGAALPNAITNWTGWGTTAKEKQAMIDRVKQLIGKGLEGGVLRKEDEVKYTKILPTIGDNPAVVKAKLDGLDAALARKRDEQLSSLEDAGYNTARYRARPDAAPPPSGSPVKAGYVRVKGPNGQTGTMPVTSALPPGWTKE